MSEKYSHFPKINELGRSINSEHNYVVRTWCAYTECAGVSIKSVDGYSSIA